MQVPRGELVVNLASGVEIFATEGISLLFGLSTDSSSRPKGGHSQSGLTSSMSFIGVSSGMRLQSGANTFTMGFVARHGAGRVSAIVFGGDPDSAESASIEESSGMLTMSWTRSLSKSLRLLKTQIDGAIGN